MPRLLFSDILTIIGIGLGVLGVIVGIGVAIAMDPKSKGELIFSIGCFVFSGLVLCLTVGVWAVVTNYSATRRILIAGPLFFVICLSLVEASRWAKGRYQRVEVKSESASSPSASQTEQNPKTDEVRRIEHLLEAVPDSAYRQLVASVIYAFDPHATLSVGSLVGTPDGPRTVDIELRSSRKDGAPLLVAIDVIDLPSGRKADITAVDVADSKRADIKADAMLLCSNTGFEQDAISKAKRKKIGLISILRQGDKRVKAVIEEEVYLRNVHISPANIEYTVAVPDDLSTLRKFVKGTHDVKYQGGSVGAWLQLRAVEIIGHNPYVETPLVATFNLKQPTDFDIPQHTIKLKAIAIRFQPRVQWSSETVQLDATTGIYDYVRGRIRVAGGEQSFVINGLDFDKGRPLPSPPQINELGIGLVPGEIDFTLMMVRDVDITKETKIPNLGPLIRPEDLGVHIHRQ
jgi:hypothetical protein